MGMLIDDLLSFSRLGRKALQKRMVDMGELLEGVLMEVSKNTMHNAVIHTERLLNVHCDPALMKQVLINLVGNAIKYSSKRSHPAIYIYIRLCLETRLYILLKITGWVSICVMPASYLESFSVFIQSMSFWAQVLVWPLCSVSFISTMEGFGLKEKSIGERHFILHYRLNE